MDRLLLDCPPLLALSLWGGGCIKAKSSSIKSGSKTEKSGGSFSLLRFFPSFVETCTTRGGDVVGGLGNLSDRVSGGSGGGGR
jgi:hypothetical protein